MAQVTYRGVAYDTDRNKAKQTNKVDLTYRGVRQEKELTSLKCCLLYTSPSPRDLARSRMPSSA